MAYRIMLVKSVKDNWASLYQYLTTTIDGVISPVEYATKEALDAKVEDMLNNGGYSKADFIIVNVIDYTVEATDYSDDGNAETSDTATEPATEDSSAITDQTGTSETNP